MKILIVSDTHGQNYNLERVLEIEKPIDMLIHLGDVEGSEDHIKSIAACRCEIVAGNNDFFSSLDREKEINIGKYNVLLTHGHYYYVSMGIEHIKREAVGRCMDIVMFGHTHKPLVDIEPDIVAINPGSLSYPRQEGYNPSYIIMNTKNGENTYEIKYLD